MDENQRRETGVFYVHCGSCVWLGAPEQKRCINAWHLRPLAEAVSGIKNLFNTCIYLPLVLVGFHDEVGRRLRLLWSAHENSIYPCLGPFGHLCFILLEECFYKAGIVGLGFCVADESVEPV